MKHIVFGNDAGEAEIAILIKTGALVSKGLRDHYIDPIGVHPKFFIGFDLLYQANNKATAAHKKDYISVLLPEIDKLGIKNVIVCDGEYFKTLTKQTKADPHYGYILPCAIDGFEHINMILMPNYQALRYNPAMQVKIDISVKAVQDHINNSYTEPGTDIIHSEYYPAGPEEINGTLAGLYQYPSLTCDIETKGLDFWTCGLSTIGFAWDQHNGIAFPIDRIDPGHAAEVRKSLKHFLETYKGTIIWHGSGYDLKVLIYELWMDNLQDYEGMLKGLHIVCNDFEDSMLATYLATNNTILNVLKLKELAMEFAGNYGLHDGIKDTEKIPLPDLLRYNLLDCLATAYVFNKYAPMMVADKQKPLYDDIFKPAVKTLLQTELCGIPISPTKVQIAKTELQKIVDKYTKIIMDDPQIQDFQFQRLQQIADAYTAKAKKKVYDINDPVVARETFNPNSDNQKRGFFYDYLGYPVYDLTKKAKEPSTAADTLEKLKANAKTPKHAELLDAFIKLGEAQIILSTFIPAFERAVQLPDGSWRLYGNFKLGGTISLRLSSAHPNLMNLPAGSVFGKLIKACFVSTEQWVFTGSDYDALEDKVNALQTRDPNKMKIYIDGFCGHCLRAYNYWPTRFPDINPNDPVSVNTMKKKYKKDRGESKAPSFALQYNGTYITLMNNCGFSKQEALSIEANYKVMYSVAIAWAAGHIDQAKKCGYVPLAFGGRLRTPLLAKCIPGRKMTFKQQAEGRSAGNALTQSYCILTIRAMNEFMERVWNSPYKYDIFPAITIHDAIYPVVRNKIKVIAWVNKNIVECMAWNQLPELQHAVVKISSSYDVHYLNWNNEITLPHDATEEEIKAIARDYKRVYDVKEWCGICNQPLSINLN